MSRHAVMFALLVLGGCGSEADDPSLGEASWSAAPGLPSDLYELTYVTFADGVWTVHKISSDEAVSCSGAREYYKDVFVELSEVAGQTTGPVPVTTGPLVATERGAHFMLGTATFDAGEINLTQVGERFVATFAVTTTTGTDLEGRFNAPLCD